MTIRLAGDDPQVVEAATIGEAWLAVARRILADGAGLDRVLAHGAAQARRVAAPTMTAARDRIGLLAPADEKR